MDEFSLAIAEELFASFPQWRAFARSEQAEDGTAYVIVEVPPPPEAHVEHGLVIDTSNGEITVGFDFYHAQFDQCSDDIKCVGAQPAIEFIERIMSERVAIVSWWLNERWRGAAQLEAGASPETPAWARPGTFNRIRIRSWKGSLNADISA